MLSEISSFSEMVKAENLMLRLANLISEVDKISTNHDHTFFFYPIPERPYTLAYTTHIGKVPRTGYMNTYRVALYYTALMNGLDNINAINRVINDPQMSNEAKIEFIKNTVDKIAEILKLGEEAVRKLIEQRETTLDNIGDFVAEFKDRF